MADEPRTLPDVLDAERIVMLVTSDQRARPMTVLDREGDVARFLTSRTADWVEHLDDGERVTITVADPDDSLFVSLSGTASTSTDQTLLDQLWSPLLEAWFDGRDDPDLVALEVHVEEGEYWDGPSTGAGRVVRGLAGVVTGRGDETMGEQGDVVT